VGMVDLTVLTEPGKVLESWGTLIIHPMNLAVLIRPVTIFNAIRTIVSVGINLDGNLISKGLFNSSSHKIVSNLSDLKGFLISSKRFPIVFRPFGCESLKGSSSFLWAKTHGLERGSCHTSRLAKIAGDGIIN